MPTSRSRPDRIHPHFQSELVLCCAVCSAADEAVARILESNAKRIRWANLLELARLHRLDVPLYLALRSQSTDLVPSSILTELHDSYIENSGFCQDLTKELLRLLDVFRRDQIPAIPFKGPIQSAQLYGDASHRRCGDLDVLIREGDVARCSELLRTEGYRPRLRLDWEWSFQRGRCEAVDVHWALTDKRHQFPFTAQQLWDRGETITVAGTTVPVLCMEDVLLALCFNGMKEAWRRYDRLRDVAALMHRGKQIDWRRFLAQCRVWGCERIVKVTMYLASELFSANLPDDLQEASRSNRRAKRTAAWVRDSVLNVERGPVMDDRMFFPRLRERLWERLPYYQDVAYSTLKPKKDEPEWRQAVRQGLYRSVRLPLIAVKKGLVALGHSGI
jgi:putative nucleotidyltransferase-like protein